MRTSGHFPILAQAIDRIHHGAGKSGNTQRLRTQEVVLPDGTPARVPFISGSSLKHLVREGAVRHALSVMAIEDGELAGKGDKAMVDLLFSGGALSAGGGAIDMSKARRMADLMPAVSMCGYSAGNHCEPSKIRCDDLVLVCLESAFMAPEGIEHEFWSHRAGHFRGEEFGTRHDCARLAEVSRVLGDASEATESQMIFEYEVLVPGSMLFSGLYYYDMSEMESAAFLCGLSFSRHSTDDGGPVFKLGAKSSVGLGRMRFLDFAAPLDDVPCRAEYEDHLRSRRSEIIDFLREVVK